MDDIRRRDLNLFFRELVSPGMVVIYGLCFVVTLAPKPLETNLVIWTFVLGLGSIAAWNRAKTKRFKAERFKMLWGACCDRHTRFHSGLKALSRRGVADLQELPKTIDSIAEDLYRALRRSDLVATEVSSSEGWLVAQPRMGQAMSPDRQAQELYRIADKNIAEYRQHYFGIMAGVERTEAQVAVFTTTLDTLRMKMLGYRLVGKDTESPTQDFLAAITEARMQLESIDKALEELDLTAFPKTISIMPDETNSPGLRENLLHSGPPPMPEGALKQFEPASEIDQEQNSP